MVILIPQLQSASHWIFLDYFLYNFPTFLFSNQDSESIAPPINNYLYLISVHITDTYVHTVSLVPSCLTQEMQSLYHLEQTLNDTN